MCIWTGYSYNSVTTNFYSAHVDYIGVPSPCNYGHYYAQGMHYMLNGQWYGGATQMLPIWFPM